jgi:TetR/AcrR family transcriptional regulator
MVEIMTEARLGRSATQQHPIRRGKRLEPAARPRGATRADEGANVAQRDAERTQAKILSAATAEFAGKGFAGARIDAIAAASGANKRMIYYYFASKDGLYTAVLERAYEEMRASETALALDHLEPVAAIRKLAEFKFDYYVANPTIIALLNGENMLHAHYLKRSDRLREMHASLVSTIERLLRRGVRQGVLRRGIDPLHLYVSLSALSYFYFSNAPTLSTAFGRKLATPAENRLRRKHVVEVILAYLKP